MTHKGMTSGKQARAIVNVNALTLAALQVR